jgi:hypothetical protein
MESVQTREKVGKMRRMGAHKEQGSEEIQGQPSYNINK